MYGRTRRLSAREAYAMIKGNHQVMILDVRSPSEFKTGRIKGAISLPDYDIFRRAKTLIPNLNTLILVYCKSGSRSHEALYDLMDMGYTNVFDFGGITSWPYEKE